MNKIKYDDKKQCMALKIFFHKAKQNLASSYIWRFNASFTFGMRNALTIFSNVKAQIISHIPIRQLRSPTNKILLAYFGLRCATSPFRMSIKSAK